MSLSWSRSMFRCCVAVEHHFDRLSSPSNKSRNLSRVCLRSRKRISCVLQRILSWVHLGSRLSRANSCSRIKSLPTCKSTVSLQYSSVVHIYLGERAGRLHVLGVRIHDRVKLLQSLSNLHSTIQMPVSHRYLHYRTSCRFAPETARPRMTFSFCENFCASWRKSVQKAASSIFCTYSWSCTAYHHIISNVKNSLDIIPI